MQSNNTMVKHVYKEDHLVNQHARLYDKLVDITELINKCYSFQIMANVASGFTYTVINSFTIYRQTVIVKSAYTTAMVVTHAVWGIYYFGFIFVTILIASLTTKEVNLLQSWIR